MSYSICDYYDICHRKWQEEYDKFYSHSQHVEQKLDAVGYYADNKLFEELADAAPTVHRIGDCRLLGVFGIS